MKTILFVENDPVVVTMYRNKLQSEGFRIETAEDGLAALKALSDITPDLVTLDLMLPKLSGADVLRFIRAEPRLKHIPIILFSNAYMTELGEDAVLASANKRLLKAYSTPASLLESINELLAAPPGEIPGAAKTNGAPSAAVGASSSPGTGGEPAGNGNGAPNGGTALAATPATLPGLDRQEFLKQVRSESVSLHEHCRSYVKAPASKESQQHLTKLHERVRRLSTDSSRTDCTRIASLLKAFDSLLTEVIAKPAWASPSVLQTIAQATDCLDLVLKREEAGTVQVAAGKVLVVDDDLVCNRVMVSSLKRANLEPLSVQDPKEGLRLLQNNHFDAILLDVNMPEMTGFELCEQLRRLSHCKTTPVIFVTAYSNFQNRTQGVLSGGDDFITKPVSPLELALKVTIHMLKAQAQRGNAPLPEIKPPPAELSPGVLQSIASAQVSQLKNGEGVGLEPPDVSSPATGSATSTESIPPTLPPPAPTDVVTAEPQPPIADASVTAASTEVGSPVPANLFASATETATSTDDATETTGAPRVPEESSNELLQPVTSPTSNLSVGSPTAEAAIAPASESIPVATPSTLDSFLAEARLGSPENLFPAEGLQTSAPDSVPAAKTASPEFPEQTVFLAADEASVLEQPSPLTASPEPNSTAVSENQVATSAFIPTTESQNSLIELTPIPNPTPPPSTEPAIEDLFAEALQAAVENQTIFAPNVESEKPFAPEAQAQTTESFNSLLAPESPATRPPQPSEILPPEEKSLLGPSELSADVQANPSPIAEAEKPSASKAQTSADASLPEVFAGEAPASQPSQPSETQFVTENVSTGSPEPAAEVQTSPPSIAEAETPAAPEAQTPATELPGSVVTRDPSSEAAASAVEPATAGSALEPNRPAGSPPPEAAALSGFLAAHAGAEQNSAQQTEADRVFDRIVHVVTCMIYGDRNTTAMNLRMVRLALEHYEINALIRSTKATGTPPSGPMDHC